MEYVCVCGKRFTHENGQGPIKYCPECKIKARREASRRHREKNRVNKPCKPRCYRIDWEKADSMIKQGKGSAEIAKACGCSMWSIQNRRYRSGLAGVSLAQKISEDHFNYKKALDEMIEKLHAKSGNGMDLGQFRAWLKTDDGQRLLWKINEAVGR